MPYKSILKNYSKILRKIKKHPSQIVLETTNKCNLNCPFCMVGNHKKLIGKYGNASHSHMTRKLGVMSEETFNIIYKNLKVFGIKKVYMHFQGEPFLNKHTSKFVRMLKSDGLYVFFFTICEGFYDKIL